MSPAQKVIKYLAIALAIFLIVNILGGIISFIGAMSIISGITNYIAKSEKVEENINIIQEENITKLDIELNISNLEIKTGEAIKVEYDENKIIYTKSGNEIKIKEKSNTWIKTEDSSSVIIYIPENTEFSEIEIEAGAGEINIEKLVAQKISLSIGAGKLKINELTILGEADIDGGAGKVDILSGEINNLDLDMGVGEFNLTSKLSGNNDIEQGIGKLVLNLTDSLDNYKIRVNKGIGSIIIDGEEAQNESVYGSGNNNIKIEGGIGAIEILTNTTQSQYI